MISFLEGVIDSRGTDHVVLNVGGVGFLVKTSTHTVDVIGLPGTTAVLHTSLMIRDDNPVLYGFDTSEERDLFLQLISVSGVGPRVAVSLLGALRPGELARALVTGDTGLLSKVPGVGKKTAARLCIELASKVEGYVGAEGVEGHAGDAELIEALTALGYTLREAVDAARNVDSSDGAPLEARIRKALRSLSSR
jgi:Holliday junction DNA helicase RuvA